MIYKRRNESYTKISYPYYEDSNEQFFAHFTIRLMAPFNEVKSNVHQ